MEYRCEVVERAAQPTLAVRTRTPIERLAQVVGQAYGEVWQYASQLGLQPSGAPYVAYYNMDMKDLDIEIGFPYERELPGKGNVAAGAIPGGKAATCLHVGPYPELGKAYEALHAWMAANGHTPTGVAYEIYLNDPQTTPPAELQTQLVFPVK